MNIIEFRRIHGIIEFHDRARGGGICVSVAPSMYLISETSLGHSDVFPGLHSLKIILQYVLE